MTDTTPAAELRAAAGKLRSLAAAATPGPWEGVVDDHGSKGVEASVWADSIGYYVTEKISSGERHTADAAYIAAVHPGVGLALADWLDAAAKSYDATVIGAASVWRRSDEVEERDAWVAKQIDQHALAVARQINGTAR